MKHQRHQLHWMISGFLALSAVIITTALVQPNTSEEHSPKPYMRVVDNENTGNSRLDMQVRLFTPADGSPGPTIALTGAIHIADPNFYALLQTFLEAQDLVMYEGVMPSGFGHSSAQKGEQTDAMKRKQTEMRLRFLAIMLERMKQTTTNNSKNQTSTYPPTLEDLAIAVKEKAGRRASEWVTSSITDAWGNPIYYSTADNGTNYQLICYGADGKPGGENEAADFSIADQKPLTKAEKGADPGIQRRLAKALGLTFQLDAMNEDAPNFRNVDMSIDEIENAIAEEGGDASFLFSMLEGSGFMAGVMKFGLAIIEKSPMMQAMAKLTLLETMKSVGENGMMNNPAMPGNMTAIFDVIVKQRNQVVIDTLKDTLKEDHYGPDSTIAVIYGAGHLNDLEKRLVEQCHYKPIGGFWVPAMQVNLTESGLTKEQIKMVRSMIKMMQPSPNN